MAVLVAGYVALPSMRSVAAAGVGLVSVAAIGLAIPVLRPRPRAIWPLIGLTAALIAAAMVLKAVAAPTAQRSTYPGAADILLVAAYLPLTLWLLWLGRPLHPSRDWPMILDTVGLSLAGSLVVWITFVRPAAMNLDLTGLGKIVAVASAVGSIAVLAASARVVLVWRTNLALTLLRAAVVALVVAYCLYGLAVAAQRQAGVVSGVGFLAFTALCAAAAWTPTMAGASAGLGTRHQLGPGRLTMLAATVLLAPTALLVEATGGTVTTGVAIAVVSAAIGLLVLVRLSLSAMSYRRRATSERAFRRGSGALVAATTESEVLASVNRAFAEMLPKGAHGAMGVVDRTDWPRDGATALPGRADIAVPADADAAGELCVPLPGSPDDESFTTSPATARRPDWAAVFTAPTAALLELSPILQALAEQAGMALIRIRLVARMQADERERYFRTLVLTSTDVTLITRDGRIDYATPSARAMFGRDVVRGEPFDELVHRYPADWQRRGQADTVWSDTEDSAEGYVECATGDETAVLVHRRDLSRDPTVNGVVTTLRDVTAERRLQRDLTYRASHDALTGLVNAPQFGEELRAEQTCAEGTPGGCDGGLAVLFIDLDDFKVVNDTYGHDVGDSVLATVAQRIGSCLDEDDLAARLGGDEFAVLLRGVPHAAAACEAAQRISDALAQPARVSDLTLGCQASIGLSYHAERAESASLLREADSALYAAKAFGKGHWQLYRQGMPDPTRRNIDARRSLEQQPDPAPNS
jgi:diguanylate cyclase (GGDEF)-like protein/PAS domain S-box-containing protein